MKKRPNILIRTIKRLPSQFSLVDHVVFLLRRSMTNSVKDFYSVLFKKASYEDIEEAANSISLREIKLRYEKYCFLKHFTERSLMAEENAKILNKMGFHYEKKMDNFTEVYTKIRFPNEREKSKAKKDCTDSDLNSLEIFVEMECVLTQFEEDIVYVDNFKAKYSLPKPQPPNIPKNPSNPQIAQIRRILPIKKTAANSANSPPNVQHIRFRDNKERANLPGAQQSRRREATQELLQRKHGPRRRHNPATPPGQCRKQRQI